MRVISQRFALWLVILLGLLLFVFDLTVLDVQYWMPCVLLLLVVYRWGRRSHIYIAGAVLSVLILLDYQFDVGWTFQYSLVDYVLPFVLLWVVVWLLAQHRTLQDKLELQNRQLLHHGQELEDQVGIRTAELQASERRYRLLAENSSDLIWAVDVDGTLTYASPAAQALRGVTREEEQASSWFDRMPPAAAARTAAAIQADLAALRAGVPIDATPHVAPAYRKDGTLMWTETVISPLYDEGGRPVGLCGSTRDITARHAAEEALRRSQEQLAKIFRANPGGIAIIRQSDNCFLEANAAFLAMVSYTREQLIGRTPRDLGITVATPRAAVPTMFQRQGFLYALDQQITNSRGELIDVLYSLEHVDFNDEPCYLILVLDITERKRLERALRQSEQKFASLFDASPVPICLIRGADVAYLDANPAYVALFGYSREELLGHTPLELGIVTAAYYAELSERAGLQGHARELEAQLTAKDGSNIAVLFSSEPVAIDGEQCHMTVSVDITARLRAEARVHEMLQHLQLAKEAADIGIWNWNLVDLSLEWDEHTCDMYAVPADLRRDGISYEFWRSRLHPEDRAVADPGQGDPDRVGSKGSATFRIVLPDGTIRHIQSSSVTKYSRDGRPLCMIGIDRDVTDQKHYEQLLEDTNAALEQRVVACTADLQAALAELQRASQLRDEFMAMISHELRTPLTGVLSMAELLEDQIAGPLNQRQAFYVKGINESGQRLLNVINGILSYTHLLSGKVQLEHGPVELASLLEICAASQQHKAAAKRQSITIQVEPPDLAITSDAPAIAEVLKRLLDNAIKFTPEGGQIGLEVRTGRMPDTIDLIVWDTGIGISQGRLEYILRPFAQADGSLARSHEGIGLGLAYVDQMVHLLGGTLALDSEPGRGSRFTVTLPAGGIAEGQ